MFIFWVAGQNLSIVMPGINTFILFPIGKDFCETDFKISKSFYIQQLSFEQ